MKKIGLLIICLFISFININKLDAKIEYKDLKDTLKDEGITPLFTKVSEDKNKVMVDYFYNTKDSKSLKFLNFINENYKEYGDLFELRCYEVSDNTDNLKLMYNIVDFLKESYIEAPFIILGETYFVTFNDELEENFIKAIQQNYVKELSERVSIIDQVKVKYYRNETLMVGITIGLFFLVIAGIIYATITNKKAN